MLKKAKFLALCAHYDDALSIVDSVLAENIEDIDALRLKANIIELEILAEESCGREKYVRNPDYSGVKDLYEKILRLNPKYVLALIDLGGYYVNVGEFEKASNFYGMARAALERGESSLSWHDEMEDVISGQIKLLTHLGDDVGVKELESELDRLAEKNA